MVVAVWCTCILLDHKCFSIAQVTGFFHDMCPMFFMEFGLFSTISKFWLCQICWWIVVIQEQGYACLINWSGLSRNRTQFNMWWLLNKMHILCNHKLWTGFICIKCVDMDCHELFVECLNLISVFSEVWEGSIMKWMVCCLMPQIDIEPNWSVVNMDSELVNFWLFVLTWKVLFVIMINMFFVLVCFKYQYLQPSVLANCLWMYIIVIIYIYF